MSKDPDNSGFFGDWGIQNSNSVMGDSKLSQEWSKGFITSTDRVTVVENTPVDNVRSLGAQALASANLMFNASLHHLDTVTKENETVTRENKRLQSEINEMKGHVQTAEEDRAHFKMEFERLQLARQASQEEVIR